MTTLITLALGLMLVSPQSAATGALKVGQPHQGGIIGYIFAPGGPGYVEGVTHGLIVAPSDQATAVPWYNGRYVVTGATGTALGTGKANTAAIVAVQGPGNYAARLCADLEIGGYRDWYLPSKDELDRIYDNKRAITGFAEQRYWTSSEADVNNAWPQNFANGFQYTLYDKFYEIRVRAVRTF